MCFLSLLLMLNVNISAHEWLYPVAQLANGNVLLMYQKDSAHNELFSWDPASGNAHKALSSDYTPMGICVVPGTNSFSFIDNGRIRIKHEGKRCAPALDIPVPLYDISTVSWAHNGGPTGFFSAQNQGNHGLFRCDLRGHVTPVLSTPGVDYLYPSCTESALFYITRRAEQTRSLWRCKKHAQCRCRPFDSGDVFLYSIEMMPLGESAHGHVIVDAHERPLVFLKMISDWQGFVLEHAPVLEKVADGITMKCHQLSKDSSGSWALTYLFSYTIPTALVAPRSSERLCEGFLPFVPWYESGAVYFVALKGSGLGIYSYDLTTGEVRLLVKDDNSLYCAPMKIGNYLMYGRTLPPVVPGPG